MCELVRRHQPQATIVVGGHIANRPGLARDGSTPTTSSRARASPGSARFLGEDVDRPIRHPLIVSAFGARTLGVPFGRGRRRHGGHADPVGGLPAGLQLLLDVGHVRRQGPLPSSFYEGGDELFEVMCGLEAALRRAVLLRDGRELPAPSEARPAPAGADARARQGLVALRLQLGEHAPALHDGGAGRASASRGSGSASRARTARTTSSKGTDTRALVDEAAVARHPRPRLEHRRPARAHAREHRRGHRPRRRPRHRVPPVHALHARARARRSTPSTAAKGTLLASDECPPADTHGQLRFNFRHPRIRNGRGDGVPAARLPARLRRQRAERDAHRAHAPARLARPAQGPPRSPRARPDRLRDEGPRDGLRGSAVGLRAVVRALEPRARRPPAGHPPRDRARVRLEGAARGPGRRPDGARDALARGRAASAAAGPTSRRPSTRPTPPPRRGPSSPRVERRPVAGSSRRPRVQRRPRPWPEGWTRVDPKRSPDGRPVGGADEEHDVARGAQPRAIACSRSATRPRTSGTL